MKYAAFISYKHATNDSLVAENLQKQLESYILPRKLRNKLNRTKLGRVFLDKTELSAAAELPEVLKKAINNSEFLILICSKSSFSSTWVQKEIALFLETHSSDRILHVVIEGAVHDYSINNKEPLAVLIDNSSKRTIRQKIKSEKLKLLSALLFCDYDDLYRRERKRAFQRASSIALLSLSIIAIGGLSFLYNSREIRVNESKRLSMESEELLALGRYDEALQLAKQALPYETPSVLQSLFPTFLNPTTNESISSMNNVLYNYSYPNIYTWQPSGNLSLNASARERHDQSISTSGNILSAMDSSYTINLFDIKERSKLNSITLNDVAEDYSGIRHSSLINEDELIIVTGEQLVLMNIESKSILWQSKFLTSASEFELLPHTVLSSDGMKIAVYISKHLYVYSLEDGSLLSSKEFLDDSSHVTDISFNYDDSKIAISFDSHVHGSAAPTLYTYDILSSNLSEFPQSFIDTQSTYWLENDTLIAVAHESTGDDYIFERSNNFLITAYDTTTQNILWQKEGIDDFSPYSSSDIQSFISAYSTERNIDYVAVSLGTQCLLIDSKTGEIHRTYHFESEVINHANYSEDYLFIATSDGGLHLASPNPEIPTQRIGGINDVTSVYTELTDDGNTILQLNSNNSNFILYNMIADNNFSILSEEPDLAFPSIGYLYTPDLTPLYRYYEVGLEKENKVVFTNLESQKEVIATFPDDVLPVASPESTVFDDSIIVSHANEDIIYFGKRHIGLEPLRVLLQESDYNNTSGEQVLIHRYSISQNKSLSPLLLGIDGIYSDRTNVTLLQNNWNSLAILYGEHLFNIYDIKKNDYIIKNESATDNILSAVQSTTGRFIVFFTDLGINQKCGLYVYDLKENRGMTLSTTEPLNDLSDFVIGEKTIAIYTDESIELYDLESQKLISTISFDYTESSQLAFLQNDKYLIHTSDNSPIRMYNTKNGDIIQADSLEVDSIRQISVSPDGKYFSLHSEKSHSATGIEFPYTLQVYTVNSDSVFIPFFSTYLLDGNAVIDYTNQELIFSQTEFNQHNLTLPTKSIIGQFNFYTIDELHDKVNLQLEHVPK